MAAEAKRLIEAAEIPVVRLSLRRDLNPAFHIKLGKVLKPLR